MILPLPAEIRVSFYRSPPENQSLEQHQADEELDIKVTDKEQYNYTRQSSYYLPWLRFRLYKLSGPSGQRLSVIPAA